MAGERMTVLSMGDNARLFMEDEASYELILHELDQDYILPKDTTNLPSSGFYIQVSFIKFLPHKKSTHDKQSVVRLALPSSSLNNVDEEDEILTQIVESSGEELPAQVQEKMKEVIKEFMEVMKREKIDIVQSCLVPLSINIVATVFFPEVKDVFSIWKRKILTSHGIDCSL